MTFHWIELLVVVVGGLLLFIGLALLMLRRRSEVLQAFLTPYESNIEEEFFRVREKPQEAPPEAEIETIVIDTENVPDENEVQWGTQTQ